MQLTAADKIELKDMIAEAVESGLSRRGLGADTEEGLKALQADQLWLRERRLAWEDTVKGIRRGLVKGGLLGLASVLLYAATHPAQFAGFLVHMFSSGK